MDRIIIPALDRCAIRGGGKDGHVADGHDFQRDDSVPRWRGWHAFCRGLATNLHRLGGDDKIIQRNLRHSIVATTQNIFVNTVDAEARASMGKIEAALETRAAWLN